jgi:hypothetical protein
MGTALTSATAVFQRTGQSATAVALLGAVAVALAVVNVLVSAIPLVGWIASPLVVTPVVSAGTLALAAAIHTRGDCDLSLFVPSVKEHFVPLIGAYLAVAATMIGLVLVGAIAFTFVVGLSAATLSSGDPSAAAVGSLGVGGSILALVFAFGVMGVIFIFQFVPVSIVINGVGVADAFKQSAGVIKSKPLSVLGYAVIRQAFGVIPVGAGVVVLAIVGVAIEGGSPGSITAGAALLGGLFGGVIGIPLQQIYHVAYFSTASSQLSQSGSGTPVSGRLQQ